LQDLTEEVLAATATSVDVGRVQERDSRVERGVHHGTSSLEVDAHAEVVATEPDD